MKQILLLVTVAVAFLTLGYAGRDLGLDGRLAGSTAAKEKEAPAPKVVQALGRLDPKGGVYALGAPAGARLLRLEDGLVEGKLVRAGDALGYLEGYRERSSEIEQIDAQIADAVAQQELDRKNEALLAEKEEIERDQVERFSALEIKAQTAKIDWLAKSLEQAQGDLDRMKPLVDKTLTDQVYQQQAMSVRRDKAELDSAIALRDKLKVSQEIDKRRVLLQAKERALAPEKSRLVSHLATLRISRRLAEARRDQAVLRAPIGGRILKVIAHAGETLGAKPVLQIGDTSRMYAVAEVYESSIGKVRPGQLAEIRSDALPRTLKGKVDEIGQIVGKNDVLGLDPASDAYARVVEVRVALDPDDCPPAAALTNLQVGVTIDIADAPRVATSRPGSARAGR